MSGIRVLSFGGGVDSSAILLKHLNGDVNLNIDLVIFSDTGAESEATYRNVSKFKFLCGQNGVEFVVVRKEKETIIEWVTRLGVVPLMAGGKHVCSLKFKAEVIQKYLRDRFSGATITHLIGIEANETRRSSRFTQPKEDTSVYEYPLIEWNMTRQDCVDYLAKYEIEVEKSSCVFCPFMSEGEIVEALDDPRKAEVIHRVERRFQETSKLKHQAWLDAGSPLNKGGRCNRGHWRKDSWANGQRLFIKKVDGKQLSTKEWAERSSRLNTNQNQTNT